MKITRLVTDAALTAAAGYVATKVMEPVSEKLYEPEAPSARDKEDAVRTGPPYRVAAEKIAETLGLSLTDEQLEGPASVCTTAWG